MRRIVVDNSPVIFRIFVYFAVSFFVIVRYIT